MEMIIYGRQEDARAVIDCMETLPEMQYRRMNCTHTDIYDEFLHLLDAERQDMVIVVQDGAEGMEGIIASQKICPAAMKVWISDDEAFGIQAHRLNCAYFAVKPITAETVSKIYRAYRRAARG